MTIKRVALALGGLVGLWLTVSEVRHPMGIENAQTVLYDGQKTDVRIIYNSPLVRLDTTRGLTIWSTIHVGLPRDSVPALYIRHEVEHVKQWHQLGVFGFIKKYTMEQWQHGYKNNELEQQARLSAQEPLQ